MKWSVIALFALTACDSRPDQWDAFVYPDADDLTVSVTMAGFKTFELCQQAAIDRLRDMHRADEGDYECGYKCRPDPSLGGINVCKETKK